MFHDSGASAFWQANAAALSLREGGGVRARAESPQDDLQPVVLPGRELERRDAEADHHPAGETVSREQDDAQTKLWRHHSGDNN